MSPALLGVLGARLQAAILQDKIRNHRPPQRRDEQSQIPETPFGSSPLHFEQRNVLRLPEGYAPALFDS